MTTRVRPGETAIPCRETLQPQIERNQLIVSMKFASQGWLGESGKSKRILWANPWSGVKCHRVQHSTGPYARLRGTVLTLGDSQ